MMLYHAGFTSSFACLVLDLSDGIIDFFTRSCFPQDNFPWVEPIASSHDHTLIMRELRFAMSRYLDTIDH